MRKRFFVIETIGKQAVKISVRYWAEQHQKYFPTYGFTNRQSDFPITHEIARTLQNKLGYIKEEFSNEVILTQPKL